MEKCYRYHIELEMISNRDGGPLPDPVVSESGSPEDIIGTVVTRQRKELFPDRRQSLEFTLGLKLLGDVLLRNPDSGILADFIPAFRNLIIRAGQ